MLNVQKTITLHDAQGLWRKGLLTMTTDKHGRIVTLVNNVKVRVTR